MNSDPPISSPKVLPETLLVAGQLSTALAEAIKALAAANMEKPVQDLTAQLVDLSRSVRWLLKEDRDKYVEANGAEPNGTSTTNKYRSKAYIKPTS